MLQQNALEKLAARDRWDESTIGPTTHFLNQLIWFGFYSSEFKIRSAADHFLRFKESGVASFKLRCAKGVKCKVSI